MTVLSNNDLIWRSWINSANRHPEKDAIIYWGIEGEISRITWGDLMDRALVWAARAIDAGVQPGEVCATLLPNGPGFAELYMGIVLAGAVPAVLATPNPRLHPDKFRDGLAGMLERSGFDWIVTGHELDAIIMPQLDRSRGSFRGVLYPAELSVRDMPPGQMFKEPVRSIEDACLLQHSSGTTGLQKPVVLSHRAVAKHLDIYCSAIEISERDRVVSWLPLYHDMGLITSFHLPLRRGLTLIQLDPIDWVRAPLSLLDAISTFGATVAWLPNFAYNLIAQRASEEDRMRLNLRSLRLLVNCSEPVRAASHELFLRTFETCGLTGSALGASYAMAETTFAVTQTPPGAAAKVLKVDPERLRVGEVLPVADGNARSLISSGRALDHCAVQIHGSDGAIQPEGSVGDIVVASVSLFSGYRNRPEATAAVLQNGWYKTGDIGFNYQGELYVVGRKKDLIIVAGKNIHPEDVEDAVSAVDGVIAGRVVALGVLNEEKGTEEVFVVAETAAENEEERRKICNLILKAGLQVDVTIRSAILIAPRQLIKSTSGKPARSANRIHLPLRFAGVEA
jgi:acyl-CoA synthetase (AMP-forming)/AMP-acid ligase II